MTYQLYWGDLHTQFNPSYLLGSQRCTQILLVYDCPTAGVDKHCGVLHPIKGTMVRTSVLRSQPTSPIQQHKT